MGLINIDDRDVFNYFTAAPIVAKEQLKEWLMGLKANNPTVRIATLGGGIYQMDLDTITCAGVDVTTRFNIPFMHQILKMSIKHTDSSNADSTDDLAYSVSKRHHPNLWMLLLNIALSTASDILDEYEDYYAELGEYMVVSNTTNTDRLHINILFKITGD